MKDTQQVSEVWVYTKTEDPGKIGFGDAYYVNWDKMGVTIKIYTNKECSTRETYFFPNHNVSYVKQTENNIPRKEKNISAQDKSAV